ncbi:ABC transporter permease [Paractinoplanes lichenicola]|uniref:FtsX-like permease family protein n=1 Tax=Paractinoplanes lichenicola TaxID=2802976 RepID=A0ABS1W025_9ACTN|nr:ABC transporter permease [Actinoplanes lichenicola]MBL7260038.1 FtsX-like permease family protein [Actinoplanes lichenicola]
MRRLSGRFRSSLIIGIQGIRARKLRTLLSMVSLFLGVLAVVVVQAGASIAERALLADLEIQQGYDGTRVMDMPMQQNATEVLTATVRGREDAVAMLGVSGIVGEPGVLPVNPGGAPLDQDWGPAMVCNDQGCEPAPGVKGQAVEVRLTALSGDVRKFRPYRTVSGQWLDFTRMPSMSPKLVLNQPAADAFEQYRVPAEMRVGGAAANVTPQFVGVVDDGDMQPRAYVRLDELTTWLPPSRMSDPNTGGEMRLLMTQGSPVEPVVSAKLKALGVEPYVQTIETRKEQEKQLTLMRLVFFSMAGLVLLIGVAGILNVGLATVGERVEEFALRRAVGTPRTLLAGIVLAETLLTGLLTAAAAIGASAAALKVVTMLVGDSQPILRDVQFPWEAGVAGIIAGIVAGVLGGFVPALRAAGIPIATVMRA